MDKENAYNLFSLVFGYQPKPYFIDGETDTPDVPDFNKLGSALYAPNSFEDIVSFAPVRIKHKGREFYLPYSTIALTNKKIIKSTLLTARGGEVHEQIGNQSWKLTIKGIYIEKGSGIPETGINELAEMYNINDSVELINPVADYFLGAESKVILTKISLPDMQGVSDAQAFNIEAIEDSELTLEATNEDV
ncbi:MAG: DUF6046 domain-containing protein [Bacteroidales bacterium]|nr:DUF6046 domain-containing protein [Bacteroidales bacterium]